MEEMRETDGWLEAIWLEKEKSLEDTAEVTSQSKYRIVLSEN